MNNAACRSKPDRKTSSDRRGSPGAGDTGEAARRAERLSEEGPGNGSCDSLDFPITRGSKGKRRSRSALPAGASRSVASDEVKVTDGGEQPLPAYGCCCLGSIDLTRFVREPFEESAWFDHEVFCEVVAAAVRMLDNVLDGTPWPLPQQRREAMDKRRIGLGFLGLGDALIMLGLRYDSQSGREKAANIAESLRNAAYEASVAIAEQKGAFPLFDTKKYLASGFAQRLPQDLRKRIAKYGIRNSHLVSIAPTGTISLAFADNASGGVEPPFAWHYQRKVRQPDESTREYPLYDHAFRLWLAKQGLLEQANAYFGEGGAQIPPEWGLPEAFVSALEIGVLDHMAMAAAVIPYVDSAISKTVNVPEDYPVDEFKDLYFRAWSSGLKGITTYRPSDVRGSVLSLASVSKAAPEKGEPGLLKASEQTDPDRRVRVDTISISTLSTLRSADRPYLPEGNPSYTYVVNHPHGGKFAIFIGHIENGKNFPFEVWIEGTEQPRGLGALAKTLSMDMRSEDRAFLLRKLESLAKTVTDGEQFGFLMPSEEGHTEVVMPSIVSCVGQLIRYRCEQLGAFADMASTPMLDALMSRKEPKTDASGTLSWTVDILNANTGDDFLMGLKEMELQPSGQKRPYSVWFSGQYPKALDGLCKVLSLDMQVIDPAWIGKKLRKLVNFAEAGGDFWAQTPGSEKQSLVPSTVAYVARLMIHRYHMLGILDEEGYPVEPMGLMERPGDVVASRRSVGAMEVASGRFCQACRTYSLVPDGAGCFHCGRCGFVGQCG